MELNEYEEFFGDLTESNIEDWNNFDFVLSKVKQDGMALYYASNELKDNGEIVKIAVKQKGWALYYASEKLRDNEEIVKEAVKQNGFAFQFASENLQKEFIKKQPELIKYVNQTPELVKLAIDSGLKDKTLIKISKEELLKYISSLNKKSIKP